MRAMIDLLVRRGRVVGEDGVREQSIAVVDGRIAALLASGEEPAAREVIEATGKLVLPGLVDSHVHFREPGMTHKEDFQSGSLAAAAGGVTTVMVMPTDNPFTLTPDDFAAKIALAQGRCHIDFALQAGLGPDRRHMRALAEFGAISFELFMSDLPPELLTHKVSDLVLALEAVRDVGGIAGVTPGDDGLYRRAAEIARGEHGASPKAFARSRPPEAEALGVAQACTAALLTGARVHLRQISCAASLRVLEALRGDGITAEVTPHNLTLSEADFIRLGAVAKVAPPLRAQTDVDALRTALTGGALDVVATDHAPHHPDEKAAGATDIWKAPGGFPGVQTFLPLMLRLVEQGVIDYARLVRTCCANPARLFGLYPRKGALQVNSDADFVIVDPGRPFIIRDEDQFSKARNVPFADLSVNAAPVLACLRGTVIMREGRPVAPAIGRFLRA
jgi:dihydroorotase